MQLLRSKLGQTAWLLTRFYRSENTLLLALAITVGLATGAGVWLFRRAIDLFHLIFADWLAGEVFGRWIGPAGIVVALAAAGFIAGWMMQRFVGEERHHGVAGIMEAVALAGGRLRARRMPPKAVIAALSLGAGASVGPEDPSVQIGANLGSAFGQALQLSEERMRVLVAAGTASAVAAAFNAPIAGVFFALEVILGEMTTSSVGVVVLASVMASVFVQAVEPGGPELGTLFYRLGSPLEIPLYIVLGLALAPFAVAFIRLMYWQRELWNRLERVPRPVRTAAAGAMVGAVGIVLPEILGSGREAMSAVLSGESQAVFGLLIILGIAKLVMTTVSLGGGFQGGVFAPSLFIGVMLGGAFGQIVTQRLGQDFAGDPQAYAIAGMAGMMAGVLRAPITAILLVFELTNDYRLILPIMLTTVVCIFVADRAEPFSIYARGLWQKGIRLHQGRDVDVMQSISAREVMRTPAPAIREEATLVDLRDRFRAAQTRSLCVIDAEGRLSGIVTLADLQRAYSADGGSADLRVGDICAREVITATPGETLGSAIQKMGAYDVMSLPVVREHTRELAGLLGRRDVMRAYQIAILQKQKQQSEREQVRLDALTGGHAFEWHVEAGAPVASRRIRDIDWPAEAVVAAIHRKGRIIVPRGDTVLQADDRVTVVAAPEHEAALRKLFREPGAPGRTG